MKLNEATQNAIARALPLYLTAGFDGVEVRAEVAFFETGGRRSRRLCVGDLPKVLAFCCEIFVQGGAVDIDTLDWWRDFMPYAYGWNAVLESTCADLRHLWRMTQPLRQPDWEGKMHYLGDCRNLIDHGRVTNDEIKAMVKVARKTTLTQFERACGRLPAETLADIASDRDANYYRSALKGRPCMFYQYAGFEFIWQ